MPLSDKTNVLVQKYIRKQAPTLPAADQHQYLQDELSGIERSTGTIAEASIQVTDVAPTSPRKGMVRYAISPWNPLSNGFSGLVVYSGSSWVSITATTSLSGKTYADFV